MTNPRHTRDEDTLEYETVEECQAALIEAEQAAEELRDKYLRAAADVENIRKRAARDAQARAMESQRELLRRLIEVMDNLERAVAHTAEQGELARGVQLTLRQFEQVLVSAGVQRIEAEPGDPFDPNLHEAVAVRRGPVQSPTVFAVEQAGYRHDGMVLRPARVVVIQ